MIRDLAAFGLLKISGPDAKKFLQGQLTCDLEKLAAGQFSLGAHCNPQGRVISLFYLFCQQNNFYMLMHRRMLDIALNTLRKYSVFYKVTLECASDELQTEDSVAASAKQCFKHLVSQSVPAIYPETSGKFLPHELNLQNLNAIDFNKGCYTGQEIIARMHYRGKIKNHLYRYKLLNDTLLVPGSDIYTKKDASTRACGSVVDVWQENKDYHALVIMNEENVRDTELALKDNIPVNLQLISDSASEE